MSRISTASSSDELLDALDADESPDGVSGGSVDDATEYCDRIDGVGEVLGRSKGGKNGDRRELNSRWARVSASTRAACAPKAASPGRAWSIGQASRTRPAG